MAIVSRTQCVSSGRRVDAYNGARDIGNRVVMVVASRRNCQGTLHCSEDYQTIVTQSSSIDYI